VEASDDTMKERLMKRGETSGRVDDNEESIKNRLETFHKQTKPVIDHYDKQGKLRRINAEQTPDKVFADIKKALDNKGDQVDDSILYSGKSYDFLFIFYIYANLTSYK
jgi:thymidylate kinase